MNGVLNVDSSSDSDSEGSSHQEALLRFLMRRNHVAIIPDSNNPLDLMISDSEEDDFFSMASPPRSIYVIGNTDSSLIEGNDINQTTLMKAQKLSDEVKSDKLGQKFQAKFLPSMLKMRELGMNGKDQFSRSDRCMINQRFLPNTLNCIDNHGCKIFCGTFAENGNLFLSASQDYCIRLYDSHFSQFKVLKTVHARDVGWSILDTAVSPDGCHFIYCSWSESIHICNVFGEQETHYALHLLPEDSRFGLFAMRFSQDGHEILAGANDECLYVYNREENKRTLRIRAHSDDVNTVAFADNTSQILFSGSDDGLCKVWDRRTLSESHPKPVGVLVGHEGGITYVDSKGDGRFLITNSKDQSIKLWDMRKFSPSSSIDASRKAVMSHNWDYRWQKIPKSLMKAKRKLWGDTSLMTYRGHSVLQTLIRCHFSPESTTGQQYIYTGCGEGRIFIYDLLTGAIRNVLTGHHSCVRDVSWHPYRNEIISSSWDGKIGKWTYFGNSYESYSDDESDDSECECDERTKEPCGNIQLRRSKRLADLKKKQAAEKR